MPEFCLLGRSQLAGLLLTFHQLQFPSSFVWAWWDLTNSNNFPELVQAWGRGFILFCSSDLLAWLPGIYVERDSEVSI